MSADDVPDEATADAADGHEPLIVTATMSPDLRVAVGAIPAGGVGLVAERAVHVDNSVAIRIVESYMRTAIGQAIRAHGVQDEQIATLFVMVNHARVATAFVNVVPEILVLPRRRVVGPTMPLDDAADIASVRFRGVGIEEPVSVFCSPLFGFRRGVFFDGVVRPRDDLGRDLAEVYSRMMFDERVARIIDVLPALFDKGWFPFMRLSTRQVEELALTLRIGADLASLESRLVEELRADVASWTDDWNAVDAFRPHMEVLADAARRFIANDVTGAFAVLWPKVEGLLRSRFPGHRRVDASRTALADGLDALVAPASPFLPRDFDRFLGAAWFAQFNPAQPTGEISRHAFAHGVGPDERTASHVLVLQLLLMVDQLAFAFRRLTAPSAPFAATSRQESSAGV
jgi:hypothetical protein